MMMSHFTPSSQQAESPEHKKACDSNVRDFDVRDSDVHDLDVLIIGGGISGLMTAWWLAQSGLRVQVWEKSHRPGGKIKTDTADGFRTEQSASMIMNFKAEVDQFFTQSGLEQLKTKRLLKAEKNRYLINKGKLQPLPMTVARLFFSSMWSTQGKFRLLMEPFIGKAQKGNETVSEFITRRFGREFLEKAMEPFIAGTLASDPDLASAQYVIPRLTALEQRFGSISAGIVAHKIIGKRTARNPECFSFDGGMETLPEHLANDPKVGFQANITVKNIIRHGSHNWEVQAQGPNGDIYCKARHVVISSPADVAAQLLQTVSRKLSQILASIEYAPLSVVHIGFDRSAVKHPLDSAGFLVPRQEKKRAKMTINGNLWMSSVFSQRAPKNCVLLSSYIGGARQPSAINLSTEESIDHVLRDISPLLGINADPTMGRVNKHQKALPLYHGHYHKNINMIEQELNTLPGLHLEANYIGGVSIRDRIVSSKETASEIITHLSLLNESIHLPDFNHSLIETPA